MAKFSWTTSDHWQKENLAAALELVDLGFYVFPCRSSSEDGYKAKTPLIKENWRNAATRDTLQIAKWWARWPMQFRRLSAIKAGSLS